MRILLSLRPSRDRELTIRQSPLSQEPVVSVGYELDPTFPDSLVPDPPTDIEIVVTNRSTDEVLTTELLDASGSAVDGKIQFSIHNLVDRFPYLLQIKWTDSVSSLDHQRYVVINCRGLLL